MCETEVSTVIIRSSTVIAAAVSVKSVRCGLRSPLRSASPAAALYHERRIAAELDRVAQSLLGVQQQRLADERAAVPHHRAEEGALLPLVLETPLIAFPAFRPALQMQQQAAAVEIGVGMQRV